MVLYKYVCVLLVIVFWFYVLVYKIYNLLYSWDWLNIFGVIFVNNVFWGWEGKDVWVGLLLIYLLFFYYLLWFMYVYLVNKYFVILFMFVDML